MQEKSKKQTLMRKPPERVVKILAEKYEVTERYIQMVISGDYSREDILLDYLNYHEKHNLLLEEVKRIVPVLN